MQHDIWERTILLVVGDVSHSNHTTLSKGPVGGVPAEVGVLSLGVSPKLVATIE